MKKGKKEKIGIFSEKDLYSGNMSFEEITARNERIEADKKTVVRKNRTDDCGSDKNV